MFASNVDLFQGSIFLGVVKLEGTSVKYIFQVFEKGCAVVFLLTRFPLFLPSFPLHPTCAKGAGSSGNNLKYQAFQTRIGGKNMLTGFWGFFLICIMYEKNLPLIREADLKVVLVPGDVLLNSDCT